MSQPPSSVAGACRMEMSRPFERAVPPGRRDPAVHGVDLARPVDQHDAAVPEAGDVVEEQPDRAGLVHHDVVALVRAAPVHVDVRDLVHAGVRAALAQRGRQQQPVGPALLDQVAVVVGRPSDRRLALP